MACLTMKDILNHLGDEKANFSDVDQEAILMHAKNCTECKNNIEEGEKMCQMAGFRLFDFVNNRIFFQLFLDQGPEKFLFGLQEIPAEATMTEEELKQGLDNECQNLPEEYFRTLHERIMKGINEIRRAKEKLN